MKIDVSKQIKVFLTLNEHEARALASILNLSGKLSPALRTNGVDAVAVEDVSRALWLSLASAGIHTYGA